MARPPRERMFKTDEELKAFRRDNIAKARAKREAKVKDRRKPLCHPDREQVGKTGLCHECYIGGAEAQKLTLDDALKLAKKIADPEQVKELKTRALALLMERLPEYSQLHFEATKMAALKGDARPAEWALTTIKEAGGQAVLEPPQKEALPSGTKIFVGVSLGGITPPDATSKPIEAVVSTDARTS